MIGVKTIDANAVFERIKDERLVAIIRSSSLKNITNIVESLFSGGIRIIELTMNTPGALNGIEQLKKNYPELIIGAGTVLDSESARLAILSGADFLLTPALKESTIVMANRYNKLIIPGAFTPTEALTAYEKGAQIVKIFPARSLSPSFISDLQGPLPQLQLMSVGGITLSNAEDFLKAGSCSLGIGSSLVDEQLVESGSFLEIEKRASRFVDMVNRFKALDI